MNLQRDPNQDQDVSILVVIVFGHILDPDQDIITKCQDLDP